MTAAVDVAPTAQAVRPRIALWVAPLVVLAVALSAVNPYPVGAVYDDAVYVEIAKALATGRGYRYLHLPGMPFAAHFPPGFPFFLSILWRVDPAFPSNVVVFKVANAVLVAVAAVWIARFAQERFSLSDLPAAGAAVLLSVGVPTLVLSTLVMSEPLFLAVALPALLLGERIVGGDRRVRAVIGAGAVAGAATLVRTDAGALVIAVLALLVVRRRFRDAVWYAAAAGIFELSWMWWVYTHHGGMAAPLEGTYGPYATWWLHAMRAGGLPFFQATVARTSGEIEGMVAVMSSPVLTPPVGIAALVGVGALGALGAWRIRRRTPVTLVFLFLYLSIVVVWPYQSTRFVWAVWPLLGMLPLAGLVALWQWPVRHRLPRWLRALMLAAAVFPAIGYLRYNVVGYANRYWDKIPQTRSGQLWPVFLKVASATKPDAILAASDDAAIYLYTGRQAVSSTPLSAKAFLRPLTVPQDAERLRAILDAYHIDAVIATTRAQAEVADLLASERPPLLALTDSFPGGLIYSSLRK